ncbi:MAG: hypothetical protein QM500_19695, partial [Methylococcales bacterium]
MSARKFFVSLTTTKQKLKALIIFCLFYIGFGVYPAYAAVTFTEDFETGALGWSVDNGLWETGIPTLGPTECASGITTQCAGTVLAGNYEPNTDSRFISPVMVFPVIVTNEELHLRFQSWFSYSASDSGQVQISVWDAATS